MALLPLMEFAEIEGGAPGDGLVRWEQEAWWPLLGVGQMLCPGGRVSPQCKESETGLAGVYKTDARR